MGWEFRIFSSAPLLATSPLLQSLFSERPPDFADERSDTYFVPKASSAFGGALYLEHGIKLRGGSPGTAGDVRYEVKLAKKIKNRGARKYKKHK